MVPRESHPLELKEEKMPLINFKKQFSQLVEQGIKTQTIRTNRKFPIKKGNRLFLYTGLRTKQTKKLKETVCKSVQEITIDSNNVLLDGVKLSQKEIIELAKADGFNDQQSFANFFKQNYNLPFYGVLIKW